MRFQASDSQIPFVAALSVAALILALLGGAAPALAGGGRRPNGGCRVPHLAGLTIEEARRRAARAGCRLRLEGARLQDAAIQTVQGTSPAAGRRSSRVEVWLNPLCRGSAVRGPESPEPLVTVGPTELVSGFYLDGGPAISFSAPHCTRTETRPGAGTVEVINAGGAVVATATSSPGHFVEIPLPAGSYTVRGTFLEATINGAHPSKTQSVVIEDDHTVRQDFLLSIP